MVVAGAVTKPVLFVGSVVAKPLLFAGQKAFNSSAKFLGLSGAKEAKVAANAATKTTTNAGKAEEVLFSGGIGKEINNTGKLTKERLCEYLKNIEDIPKEKLISDLEQINIIPKSKVAREFIEFVHVKNWSLMTQEELRIAIKESPVQFKIHPPDKITHYHHVHVYDKLGNSLDASLSKVAKNSAEAHIKIEDFVKIFMENKI